MGLFRFTRTRKLIYVLVDCKNQYRVNDQAYSEKELSRSLIMRLLQPAGWVLILAGCKHGKQK